MAVLDAVISANEQLGKFCVGDSKLQFVDPTPMLLPADGKPRPELLREDLHHLNKDGFDLASPVANAMQAAEARYARGHGRSKPSNRKTP